MASKNRKSKKENRNTIPIAPEPIDVINGMPDVADNRAGWKYIALGIAFVTWVAFLIYCAIA